MAAYRRVYDSRHLPRTGINSGTLHAVIEYGLPLPFYVYSCIDKRTFTMRMRSAEHID